MLIKIERAAVLIAIIFSLAFSGCSVNVSRQKDIVKKTRDVWLSSLTYKQINNSPVANWANGIASMDVCGNICIFSAGSLKDDFPNPPSLLYRAIVVYELDKSKVQSVMNIDKGFVQIDWARINRDWIVWKEIKYEFGGPVKIYAINRRTGKKEFGLLAF